MASAFIVWVRKGEAQERLAWMALVIFGCATVYLCWQLFFSAQRFEPLHAGHVNKVASRFFLLFAVAVWYLRRRFRGVYVDERDRAIAHRALEVGFMLLALLLVLASAITGLHSYDGFIHSVPPIWLSNCMLMFLSASAAVTSAVRVHAYLQDRR